MTKALLQKHYHLNYPDDKNNINKFFDSLNEKLTFNLNQNINLEESQLKINDIIINEVINFNLPYQNDEYISNLINLFRDISIKSYAPSKM